LFELAYQELATLAPPPSYPPHEEPWVEDVSDYQEWLMHEASTIADLVTRHKKTVKKIVEQANG